MIQVTRDQAFEIRKRLPHENVTICNRQSKSKKRSYYAPESYSVLKLIRDMESKKKIEHFE